MPEILKSSKAAIDKRLLQKSPFEKLCSDIIPSLVEALVKEEVIKISAIMLDSLEDCLELSGSVLNIDQIKRFLSVIMHGLDTSILIPKGNEASEQGEKVRKKILLIRVPCCNSSTSFYHLWNIYGLQCHSILRYRLIVRLHLIKNREITSAHFFTL